MKNLSGKPSRTVGHALDHLFIKRKSWIDVQGPDDLKKYDFLERKVDLSDHRVVLLTDEGYGHLRTIVATISDENLFESRVAFSDIWNAVRDVFGSCLSNNQRPSGVDDLLEEVVCCFAALSEATPRKTPPPPAFR